MGTWASGGASRTLGNNHSQYPQTHKKSCLQFSFQARMQPGKREGVAILPPEGPLNDFSGSLDTHLLAFSLMPKRTGSRPWR